MSIGVAAVLSHQIRLNCVPHFVVAVLMVCATHLKEIDAELLSGLAHSRAMLFLLLNRDSSVVLVHLSAADSVGVESHLGAAVVLLRKSGPARQL